MVLRDLAVMATDSASRYAAISAFVVQPAAAKHSPNAKSPMRQRGVWLCGVSVWLAGETKLSA